MSAYGYYIPFDGEGRCLLLESLTDPKSVAFPRSSSKATNVTLHLDFLTKTFLELAVRGKATAFRLLRVKKNMAFDIRCSHI